MVEDQENMVEDQERGENKSSMTAERAETNWEPADLRPGLSSMRLLLTCQAKWGPCRKMDINFFCHPSVIFGQFSLLKSH